MVCVTDNKWYTTLYHLIHNMKTIDTQHDTRLSKNFIFKIQYFQMQYKYLHRVILDVVNSDELETLRQNGFRRS